MITDKDREEANGVYAAHLGGGIEYAAIEVSRIRAESAEQAVKDCQDVIDDYRRLTKELDIALNGDCAAKQASLCDIVAQIRSLGTISEIVTRSAGQARKEAAEMAVEYCSTLFPWGKDGSYARGLRTAILGDSAIKENLITDHIPDTGKKLAIAVKALERASISIAKTDGDYDTLCVVRDALKEIQ